MNRPTVTKVQRVRPYWIEDLNTFYQGRIARQFILHFNITDIILNLSERHEDSGGMYMRRGKLLAEREQLPAMREYLHDFLFQDLRCQAIYTYSLAGGLIADDAHQNGIGVPLSVELHGSAGPAMQRLQSSYQLLRPKAQERRTQGHAAEGQEIDLPTGLADNFKLLGHMLRQPYYSEQKTNAAAKPVEAPIAVILDYVEKLIPYHTGEGQGDREQLQALEIIQRWALDPKIRDTKNIIILLTTNVGQLPTSVYAEGSGCRAIRVPLPDEYEREAYISFRMAQIRPPFVELDANDFGASQQEQAHRLARSTQGMRLMDIDNVSRRVTVEARKRGRANGLLKADDVQRIKAEVIQAQSAQLLEIVAPVRGFNEIGGLNSLKTYLRKRTLLMLQGKYSPLVPSGILLAGPPGTGKTIIAEALAMESGFNLVKMRNIQDKWVGSSERNLELVLNLLKDLHPVVVFVDEIDQAMGRRDTGQNGDSGVGARMFGRILEEMSNSANRGRILWVAATNRADILDDALLRRFDRVVPLLVPDVDEACRIFATMLKTIIKQSGGNIKVAYGDDLAQSGNLDENKHPNPTAEDLKKFQDVAEITAELGLTGASIEIIVRRAIELAYEEMMDAYTVLDEQKIPLIALRHLMEAQKDFKPNHNRATYDYQSLIAIRACNFYSVIPELPKAGVFGRIQRADGRIDPEGLELVIRELASSIRI